MFLAISPRIAYRVRMHHQSIQFLQWEKGLNDMGAGGLRGQDEANIDRPQSLTEIIPFLNGIELLAGWVEHREAQLTYARANPTR